MGSARLPPLLLLLLTCALLFFGTNSLHVIRRNGKRAFYSPYAVQGPGAAYHSRVLSKWGSVRTPWIVPPKKDGPKMMLPGGSYHRSEYGKLTGFHKSAYMEPDYPTRRYEHDYSTDRTVNEQSTDLDGPGKDKTASAAVHQFPWAMDYKYAKGGDAVVMPGIRDPKFSKDSPTEGTDGGDLKEAVYGKNGGDSQGWRPPTKGIWAPNVVDPGFDPIYPASQMPTTAMVLLSGPWLAEPGTCGGGGPCPPGQKRFEDSYTGRNWNLRYREGAELDT